MELPKQQSNILFQQTSYFLNEAHAETVRPGAVSPLQLIRASKIPSSEKGDPDPALS